MEEIKTENNLNITFHDPNTPDEAAKVLIKIIAENINKQIAEKKIKFKSGV